jgi:hypothetical protein
MQDFLAQRLGVGAVFERGDDLRQLAAITGLQRG